jgi:hypothetical protein
VLNEAELEDNIIMKTVLSYENREDYESKLGDVIYTFPSYERLKGTRIQLDDGHYPDLAV